MERDPLPVWVKAENGDYVNLARMHSLMLDDTDATPDVCVIATNNLADYTLARCVSEEQAYAALSKLVSLLPIAVVDMTLDVIAPLEREWHTEEAAA